MIILKDRLLDVPIMSLQTGAQIAQTSDPIIDPRELKIVAFYCSGPALDVSPAVLHTEDIREMGELGMIVDSADNLMSPEGLVRLNQIIGFGFTLIGKQVIDDQGRKIGKVINYDVDPNSFYIIKMHVEPGLLRRLQLTEVLIDRSQVRQITDKAIIVKAPTLHEPHNQPARPPHAVVDNPFRRPQAEASSQNQQRR